MTVDRILEELGVNRTYLGYWAIKDIVTVAVEDEEVLQDMQSFYDALAMKYNRQPSAIEKNMRTAIQRAWRVSSEKIKKMARYELYSMPSNGEFVDILVTYLLRQKLRLAARNNPC